MYGILNNSILQLAPDKLFVGSSIVYNPTNAQLETTGYKKVVFTEKPICDEGYHAEMSWRETDKQIRQEWAIVQNPPEEAGEQDFIEALEDLGVNINDES